MVRVGIFLFAVFLASSAFAQEELTHSGEIYALASAAASDTFPQEINTGAKRSAAGFRLGGTWKLSPSLGLVADFGRHAASNSTDSFSFTTIMIGPRFYTHETFRTSGFAHVLGGVHRTALTVASGPSTEWRSLWSAGAGVDIRLKGGFAFRAVEGDLMLVGRGGGPLIGGRISSGFVYRFGQK